MGTFLDRAIGGIKSLGESFAVKNLPYGWGNAGWYTNTFSKLTDPWPRQLGSDANRFRDYRRIENLQDNGAVSICLGVITDQFAEPELQVAELDANGDWKKVKYHDLPELINKPNKYDDKYNLWYDLVSSVVAEGNGYWYLYFDNYQMPTEIRFESPEFMKPRPSRNRFELQDGYEYAGGAESQIVPEDRVIHFKMGRDRKDRRLGFSRLRNLYREVVSDEEATDYTYWILRNMGIVGGILTMEDPDVTMTPEKAEKLRSRFRSLFTGSGRGDIMIPTFKGKYQEAGKTPEQMALDKIRQVPEDRICAALRVPIQVAGLTSGAAHKTYNNLEQAREAFYEECLIPLQNMFAHALTRHFLPLFGDGERRRRRMRVQWDYSNVRVLQPDQDRLSTRTVVEFRTNILTLNQALTRLGEKSAPGPEGDMYWYQIQAKAKQDLPVTGLPDSPGDKPVVSRQNGKPVQSEITGNPGVL